MSDYLARLGPDVTPSFTVTLTATVTGGQLVTWAGAVAGDASTNVAGVAAQDGVSGDKITVWGNGHFDKLAASGSIAQGDGLCAAASGAVRTWVTGTDPVNSRIGRARAAAASSLVNASLFGV